MTPQEAAIKAAQDAAKKKGKGGNFLNSLKDWIISPGGILTIVGFVALVLWVNHKTSK